MTVSKALTKLVSTQIEKQILLWANLLKEPILVSNRPSLEELIGLILPNEELLTEIDHTISIQLANCSSRLDFESRSNDLILAYEYMLSKSQAKLQLDVDSIKLNPHITILVTADDCETSAIAKKLFERAKSTDTKNVDKVLVYKKTKKGRSKRPVLVSISESEKDIYHQDWKHGVDANQSKTKCKAFDIKLNLGNLFDCVTLNLTRRLIDDKLAEARLSGNYDLRPELIIIADAMRRILNMNQQKWSSASLKKKIDELYKRVGPYADDKVYRINYNKAVSDIAKEYPGRIILRESMKRSNHK